MDEADAAAVICGVCDSLRYMHEQLGWMHRDVKPENIRLRNGDPSRPVLIDYGLARQLKGPMDFGSNHIQEGERIVSGKVGTPCYQAPEVLDTTTMMLDDTTGEWSEISGPMVAMMSGGIVQLDGLKHEATYGFEVDVWSLGACLYFALSTIEPTKHEHRGGEVDLATWSMRCEAGEYDMEIPQLLRTSPEMKDLIMAMMTHDVHERYTLEETAAAASQLR